MGVLISDVVSPEMHKCYKKKWLEFCIILAFCWWLGLGWGWGGSPVVINVIHFALSLLFHHLI